MLLSTLLGSPLTSMAAACMLSSLECQCPAWRAGWHTESCRDDACCAAAGASDITIKPQASSTHMHPATIQLAGTGCHITARRPAVTLKQSVRALTWNFMVDSAPAA